MSERKYTDEEIVKALECCNDNGGCDNCPFDGAVYEDEPPCVDKLHEAICDLINRQKAEIEKLHEVNADLNESLRLAAEANKDMKIELDAMRGAAKSLKIHYENARAEAIKEFAERLRKSYYDLPTASDEEGEYDYVCMEALDKFIDNLVAEMTEGK